jgi:hypothetical protein
MGLAFEKFDQAVGKVFSELDHLGLGKGKYRYLYQIDVVQSPLPYWVMENGFVIDRPLSWYESLVGYEEGNIYIAKNPKVSLDHGESLLDLIRHEYAHSWAWLEPRLFRTPEYKKAFGCSYFAIEHAGSPYLDDYFQKDEEGFMQCELSDQYISTYALSDPAEDFAETFSRFVKFGGEIERFRERPGVYKKLKYIKKMLKVVSDVEVV